MTRNSSEVTRAFQLYRRAAAKAKRAADYSARIRLEAERDKAQARLDRALANAMPLLTEDTIEELTHEL